MTTKKPNMRDEMPTVAAFIDDLRAAFGKEMIDGQIRKGMNGEGTFWATENGHTVGSKPPPARSVIRWDAQGVSYDANSKEQ